MRCVHVAVGWAHAGRARLLLCRHGEISAHAMYCDGSPLNGGERQKDGGDKTMI